MDPIAVILLLAYATLVLELVVFPIPSEASTYQLFTGEAVQGGDRPDALHRARSRSSMLKFLVYLLPTALGVVLFLVPLAAVFLPEIIGALLPLEALQRDEIRVAGVLVVICGRLLTFWSVLQLRARRAAGHLQPSGLFRLSRNPGLVGMYLFYLGNCLIFPCVVLFLGFVPYVVNMHRRVLMEESHLSRRIGTRYDRYRGSVPRYLLFGGRSRHDRE